MSDYVAAQQTETPRVLKLKIERFRGLQSLDWNPSCGMNIVLGGGDAGKTTILDAIALLFSPTNSIVLSEADYWQRKVEEGFVIQAVVELPASSEIGQQQKFAWPWEWNGSDAVPPISDEDDDVQGGSSSGKRVYRLQVQGTAELEINWEIVQPNDETDLLSAAVRRNIGIVRLSGDDRNDRDLRLVYGSALDRLLADKGLRARIGKRVSEIDLAAYLGDDAKTAMEKLDATLKAEALPSGLDLALTTSQGLSIGALIGLMADRDSGVSLPLASWGAGTRRMTALQIAAASEAESSITVIDEIERGLEPYRQRKLIKSLQAQGSQSFVTTHSAAAINAADDASLWYLDGAGHIGALPRAKVARQQERDPETFLARFAVIAEGPTEVGFLSSMLERAIDGSFADHGVRVCNGQGNPATLDLLEALTGGGLAFGGFADDEGHASGRWSALKTTMGDRLFQWTAGCTEEAIIKLVPKDRLAELIAHNDAGVAAERRITLATRLGTDDTSLEAIIQTTGDFRALLIAAATGSKDGATNNEVAKMWSRHGGRWFKSVTGGRELADKMFALGVWPTLRSDLLPFINAIRAALGQAEITDIAYDG
ncbi:MAG: ATP-binding protein [Pseudomonadota bacterium]